ncbi:SSI family serine proteinase inhibitor [Nonomuraea sp. NPDC050786]|uniref:SSI family serine proteinase inhibitor n=1 Tax=Nonomuraea sp. NPDC050786 TaxID=3154840 RepID=UPI003404039A
MIRTLGALALCGLVLLGTSSPAMAARPKDQLKLVVAVKGGETKTARLHCEPAGGTHPDAQAACELLEQVNGDPGQLNVSPDAVCTREAQPHAVAAKGRWDGKPVRWGKVFGNACLVKAATGALFDL